MAETKSSSQKQAYLHDSCNKNIQILCVKKNNSKGDKKHISKITKLNSNQRKSVEILKPKMRIKTSADKSKTVAKKNPLVHHNDSDALLNKEIPYITLSDTEISTKKVNKPQTSNPKRCVSLNKKVHLKDKKKLKVSDQNAKKNVSTLSKKSLSILPLNKPTLSKAKALKNASIKQKAKTLNYKNSLNSNITKLHMKKNNIKNLFEKTSYITTTKNCDMIEASAPQQNDQKGNPETILMPLYRSNDIHINEADTAPFVVQDSSVLETTRNCIIANSPLKWVPIDNSSKTKDSSSNFNDHNFSLVKKRKPNTNFSLFLPELKRLQNKPKSKRELTSLYQNLNEISWTHEKSFKEMLQNNNNRHSIRIAAKDPPQLKKLRHHFKPLKIEKSDAKVKCVKIKELSKTKNLTSKKSPLISKLQEKYSKPKIKLPLAKKKISLINKYKKPLIKPKNVSPKSKASIIKITETKKANDKPKLLKEKNKFAVPSLSILSCKESCESFNSSVKVSEKPIRKKNTKTKQISLFEDVEMIQTLLGVEDAQIPLAESGRHLKVLLEPLEETDLWSYEYMLQSIMHTNYELFKKKIMQKAMLKVFSGIDKDPLASFLRSLEENVAVKTDANKPKRRKREEESVRSSVRQSESACRYKEIVVKKHQNYTQVILVPNTHKQNSLTIVAMRELKEAFLLAKKDPNCRAVLLNSSGTYFCTGIDLGQLVGANRKHIAQEMAKTIKDLILVLSTFYKPVVAAVNGTAIGFGVSLLTFCDIVLASDKATFCIPAPRLGYIPEGGVTLTLPQVVGASVAMEMLLQGRRLTAQEALRYGLVSEVLWPTQLMEGVVPRMQKLTAQQLEVMVSTKIMVRGPLWTRLAVQLEIETDLLPKQWLQDICQESLKHLLSTGWLFD